MSVSPIATLTPDLTVAQVLEAYPQAAHVFVSLKTDCVGCYLMSFCTLQEVADQYQLGLESILDELARTVVEHG
jgi:hybrid cluster-associated redox disulfide protein